MGSDSNSCGNTDIRVNNTCWNEVHCTGMPTYESVLASWRWYHYQTIYCSRSHEDILFVKLKASRWCIVLRWQIITLSNFFSLSFSSFIKLSVLKWFAALVLGICASRFTSSRWKSTALKLWALCLSSSSASPVQWQQSWQQPLMWMGVFCWLSLSAAIY